MKHRLNYSKEDPNYVLLDEYLKMKYLKLLVLENQGL